MTEENKEKIIDLPAVVSPSTLVLVEEMTEQIPNKYEAVRVIAKEARNINSMYLMHGVSNVDDKPTTSAIRRALAGKIAFNYDEGEEEPPPPIKKADSDEEEEVTES